MIDDAERVVLAGITAEYAALAQVDKAGKASLALVHSTGVVFERKTVLAVAFAAVASVASASVASANEIVVASVAFADGFVVASVAVAVVEIEFVVAWAAVVVVEFGSVVEIEFVVASVVAVLAVALAASAFAGLAPLLQEEAPALLKEGAILQSPFPFVVA